MTRALTFSILLAAACGSSSGTESPVTPKQPPPPTGPVAATPVAEPVATTPTKPVTTKSLAAIGINPDNLDRTADPCDDFYQFACGGYIAKTEIPADKPRITSFDTIQDKNLEWEKGVLEQAAAKPGDDPVMKKLGAFYGACMNEAAIAKDGLSGVRPLLAKVAQVRDVKSLGRTVSWLHSQGVEVMFGFGSEPDPANVTHVLGQLDQGGLGLGEKDYYLKDDDQTKKVRDAYHQYMVELLTDAGRSPAEAAKQADALLALETDIAKVSKDRIERRDPKTMYNKIDLDGIEKQMPDFDWVGFLKAMGTPNQKDLDVTSPAFFAGLDDLIKKTPVTVWRDFLTVAILRSNAGALTKQIEDQAFKFRQTLTGQKEQLPRWKRCSAATDHALGDLLGQAFVKDKFPGNSKEAAEEEVHAIVAAMQANLGTLPWMDAATKEKAIAKLKVMAYQIGFPKKWKEYNFKVDKTHWTTDALAARKAATDRDIAKIGKPLDRDDWQMTTPTVNAYYDPQLNGMVFPAGILQPPFYSVDASIPVNLGGMGVVVGHELTHGFDDQGAQYDAEGNLKDWWQPDTEKQFKQRTQCVIDQYSKYEPEPGVFLKGAQTVGENIADIGGVKLALAAYRSLRTSAPDTVVADGFTEDQQFFLGYGQAWCAKQRPEYAKMAVMQDPHSPARFRVIGALSATPAFAKAWGCKVGSKMRPANACVVW
ncbi:MAG TPA: M13 family metallopeptidase [Kofleriaceae bacterium]|jgi:predicted metalloendopeptidase